jgi:hypothetical protein
VWQWVLEIPVGKGSKQREQQVRFKTGREEGKGDLEKM